MIIIKIFALILLGFIAGMVKAIFDVLWDIYAELAKIRSDLYKMCKRVGNKNDD